MKRPDAMSHDEANELLPWLVNDSVDESEKARLMAHAHTCIVCRRDLAELEALRDHVETSHAAVDSSAIDMRRINARIDEDIVRRRKMTELFEHARAVFANPLKLAIAVQALIIVGLAAALFAPDTRAPSFTTLTAESSLPPGQYLRVVLGPEMVEDHFAILLDRYGLAVAEGPSAHGVATLKFGATEDDDTRRNIAAALSGEAGLRFVQPLSVAETPE